MDQAIAHINNSSTRTNLPEFKVGQTVRVHQRIREGEKERIQVFEGLVINVNNGKGINGTITVRKVVDGIGVERVYPIHSPLIAKIELTKEAKVRRGKLYYMRGRSGKSARLKTTQLEGQVFEPQTLAEIEAIRAAAEAEKQAAEEAKKAEEEAAKTAKEESKESQDAQDAEDSAPQEEASAEKATPAVEEKVVEEAPKEEAPAEEAKAEEAPKEEEKKEEA